MIAVLLCVFALHPTSLHGQAASSTSISGVVTDSSGALVADATVKLTDKATNTSRTTNTNDVGRYFFANVVSGDYEITASKTGFRITKTIVTATVGIPLTVDLKLELGSVSETIEVTATGTELQTLNATVGNTVTSDTLNSLPTIGRDSGTFVTLQPGVSPDGSVAGAVVDQSTFLLDGGQNTNDMDGSMQVYTPSFGGDPTGGVVSGQIGGAPTGVMPTPIDSIEEFKVSTTNQTADFNSSAGAQVQIVTRRGTNAWHGTGYEYYLDNNFNANTWDNNSVVDANGKSAPVPLPSYHYSRFGGAGGGPIIPKKILGGETYFFGNYEGFRWANSATIERAVPSANMRAGILTFGGVQYNLNTGTNCGSGGASPCDPRGIGINPLVQQMWAKYMPLPNDLGCGNLFGSRCDGINVQGFKANMALPYRSDFAVARIDHDFGSKWHFTSSYRYYKLTRATNSQIDIGGFFPGDTLGTPASLSTRPQQPWYFVAGLTTNITSNTTNDFHFSYLRNFWSWGDKDGPAQFAGLGGALEPLGEQQFNVLAPYNVNTQSIRTRFWDGQDRFFRDDITMLKGNHLFTFGGAYQHNYDWHQRSDNGGGINYTPTYQLGDSVGGGLVDFSSTNPGVTKSTWGRYSAAVLGIVTDSQIAYTRAGSNLALNPPLTHAFDQSTIPYYNVYFSDSWHMKPSFTFTYGLGWTLEMPPVEKNGKQIELVDQSGQQLDTTAYLNARKAAALQGQVYNPQVGFALVGNTGGGQKYPYQPYYGSFSPRIAAAWNPNITDGFLGKIFGGNKTVVRGGYSRVYGRLNGVDLVLVPLLGTGLIQPVQCRQALSTGACGPNNPSVLNAFRVGTDGLVAPLPAASPTLPQPTFPGINDVSAAAGEALDPHFRPNVVDSFDLTIQRQLTNKVLLEVGYIGRRITHEYQPINLNAVPHMMTLGGQSFAKAYAALEQGLGCATSFNACGAAIPTNKDKAIQKAQQTAYANSFAPQPFFETALANTGYCAGFSSCTAAVVFNESANLTTQSVWSMWSDLDAGGIGGGPICNKPAGCVNPNGTTVTQNQQTTLPGFNFARSMLNSPLNTSPFGGNGQLTSGVGLNASIGHGNYNAGFASLKVTNWHGLTLQGNFTYSKALGTGAFVQATSQYTANDAFNLDQMYGVQNFDRKFVFNSYLLYEPPFYRSQQGFLGRVLGGWSIAPIFAAGSGAPLYCNTNTDAQSYGSADGNGFFTNEQCHFTGGVGSIGVHNTNGSLNVFGDPAAAFDAARPPILGLDTRDQGVGATRGLPYWNMDLKVGKDLKIFERVSASFEVVFVNVFNHVQFYDPGCPSACGLDPTNPGGWGAITAQGNNPRQMQFGIRLKF
ncbi:MAG: Cna protein [Candidatus Acidoferrum typicum]|nr:Cna protein [Candidatus Acidoferrum typicum]